MTAVLGGDRDEVLAKLAEHGLTPANDNGPGQIVAAGTVEELAALAADPPAKARLIPLSVAGAFHTRHMEPAVQTLAKYATAISTHDPRTRLISNRDGQVVHDGRDVLQRLVTQVNAPVRWDLCMETMADLQVTGILELPPAGTLTGIARAGAEGRRDVRAEDAGPARRRPRVRGQARQPVRDRRLADLAAAGRADEGHLHPRGRQVRRESGDTVEAGEVVAKVKSLRDELDVKAPHGGIVVEWLVEEGDPVAPGQPLVRLHPNGAQLMTTITARPVRRTPGPRHRVVSAAPRRTELGDPGADRLQ